MSILLFSASRRLTSLACNESVHVGSTKKTCSRKDASCLIMKTWLLRSGRRWSLQGRSSNSRHRLDKLSSLSHFFVPEGSQGRFTSFDICSACLAVSKRLRIGSGVIRILEHDPGLLARRLLILQQLSDNRFVLGIGTGRVGIHPKPMIRSMLDRLRLARVSFETFAEALPGLRCLRHSLRHFGRESRRLLSAIPTVSY